MLLIRALFLELLVCFHVIGAAVLFRRFFPRESPWLGFFLPTLALMCVLNFVEHFVALPVLGWLLPLTVGGLLWAMIKPGYTWEGLRLPSALFVAAFTFALFIKCLEPDVSCNGEGTADLTRVLDFCLGDKLPATDCWMPPYDHGGYYTFQHYGASILKRLFSIDLGTAYNFSFTYLNALTCLMGAGVAFGISGRRAWVAAATLLVLIASFTGSAPLLFFHHALSPDFRLSIDINEDWDNVGRNPFHWFLAQSSNHPTLRLFPPGYNIYCNEFHANLGGHFMVLASLLAAVEVFRRERSNWPWVCLCVLPFATIITSTWFFFTVFTFAIGSGIVALVNGRRPQDWQRVALAVLIGYLLLWPSVGYLMAVGGPQAFQWTPREGHTPFWVFVIQWWPVYLPWLLLCLIWRRLDLAARWLHAAVAALFLFVEFATFGDRGLTVEKMWGSVYGAGLVILLPLIFIQRGGLFRAVTVVILVLSVFCVAGWTKLNYSWANFSTTVLHLQGDAFAQNDPQQRRLMQVMSRLHGATLLPGRSVWSYNSAPTVIAFTENRCYVAWYYQEIQTGHGGEAEYRNKLDNDFYDGTMTDPLGFLINSHIAGVVIWPEDKIPDPILAQLKAQIGSEYYYFDCKLGGANNAGVFIQTHLDPALVREVAPTSSGLSGPGH